MSNPGKTYVRRREGGFTYVELLVACLILAIGAIGVFASVRVLSATPSDKRLTEMGVYVGSQEMERLKAKTYNLLAKNTSGTDWYNKYGVLLGNSTGAAYKANWSVPNTTSGAGGVDRNGTVDSEDLIELVVTVQDSGGTKTYETARTLLTFGGE